MRKLSIFFLALAAGTMMFTGCKKDHQVVTLGLELENAPAGSKVVIDENHNPVILDGDEVNVNGTNYSVSVNGSGQYVVDVNEATDGNYYAAYPASLTTGFTGTTAQPVHLSRWQAYKHNNGVQDVQLPAGAVIANGGSKKLKFYNLGSLLEIQWKNTSSAAYEIIGIEVTVPDVALYGDGQANLAGTSSSMTFSDTKKNRVNLDIAEDDRETVASNGTSRKYYVFLPTFSNKQVTVEIQTMKPTSAQTTSDDQKLKTVTVQTGSAVTLDRNKIVPVSFEGAPKENNELTGYFSVRDNYKVVFSRGNLQHVETNVHGTGTWKFADRQYDFFGQANLNTSGYDLTNTTDLFTWSNSITQSFGMLPYDYWNDEDGYYMGAEFRDWGYYKTISNDSPRTWHTLTNAEWYYLLHQRVNGHGEDLYGKAKITGIKDMVATYNGSQQTVAYGFILLPDDWTEDDLPSGLSFTPNSANDTALHNNNTYTVSEWARMEAAGAMFLPAAGYGERYGQREDGDEYYEAYKVGQYWSSSKETDVYELEAAFLGFEYRTFSWVLKTNMVDYHQGSLNTGYDKDFWYMRSVRLVKPAPGYTDPAGRSTVNQTQK